ncbi:hypothetical protein BD830_10674 [Maritimibacter alkaliphilus HTCC2654]|uniref:Uncharacterized protein n=1 Tax=Maritimibacter alkaliphilus HTCC2654 TaxID=314271 RepID=A3VAQ8_9RHOB|nr:DUF1178 family protein [Maritimibacter alkaliphilus]EAQ14999.1 hypothetical protein RB2654_20488 [Maritimibacter alkaliphilus HTCC2654]TYP80776.1 hypothetical protein BD830_10674 [Maritimibacter alkaliphilus HTCC2654]
MIRYAVKCADGHVFESWFQNAAAFDTLAAKGHVTCPDCGTSTVEKSLMAPRVTTSEAAKSAETSPEAQRDRKIAELKAKVEAEADYVGQSFVTEARKMHEGETPNRMIYGEANPKDAVSLLEDGIPIAPLPFLPTRKAN